jgi:NADPH:quinone reductase-like Zn-dependent oxidoreductase
MQAFVADHAAGLGLGEREVPEPAATPGRAIVEVHAVSLNRGEVLHLQKYRLLPEGTTAGWDVAGIVVEQAPDGAGPSAGTRVFGWSEQRGTWAERVSMSADHLAVMPPGLTMEDASTLGVAALTAYTSLRHGPRPLLGSRVVVTGATGGVGTFAVQLALLAGAVTCAVVRIGFDAARVGDLLPRDASVEYGLDPDGTPADLIVESVGGATLGAALGRVASGGAVVTLGRTTDTDAMVPSGWFHKNARLHGLTVAREFAASGSVTTALERLAHLVVTGRLRTNVTKVADRTSLPEMMSLLLERKVQGKVVVRWK